jgi:hypothetical protein
MAVNYATDVKNDRMTVVRDQIDAGAGAGYIEIGTAGMAAVLVTIALDDPSATIGGVGVLTLAGVPRSGVATGAGTADEARIRDSDANDVVTGLTVGVAAEEIVLDNDNIAIGQTVNITAGTITHG